MNRKSSGQLKENIVSWILFALITLGSFAVVLYVKDADLKKKIVFGLSSLCSIAIVFIVFRSNSQRNNIVTDKGTIESLLNEFQSLMRSSRITSQTIIVPTIESTSEVYPSKIEQDFELKTEDTKQYVDQIFSELRKELKEAKHLNEKNINEVNNSLFKGFDLLRAKMNQIDNKLIEIAKSNAHLEVQIVLYGFLMIFLNYQLI